LHGYDLLRAEPDVGDDLIVVPGFSIGLRGRIIRRDLGNLRFSIYFLYCLYAFGEDSFQLSEHGHATLRFINHLDAIARCLKLTLLILVRAGNAGLSCRHGCSHNNRESEK
jgi:hypothetical protein